MKEVRFSTKGEELTLNFADLARSNVGDGRYIQITLFSKCCDISFEVK